ncbi:MAG: hypothetical protein IT462_15720 [Planctomycetes bacterium]|nr:hypothetical protein [Planctomycetota bacterium]
MVQRGYNLTDEISVLVHLLSQRVSALAHVDGGRVLHGVVQARSRSRYGVYAQCHALRFKHGQREQTRGKWRWVWPDIRVRGREMLYYITYFLPRFLDQPPRERLHTLIHELYHISPKFNGDLRRFSGRNEYHGDSRAVFDGVVDGLVENALREIDIERFAFLQHSFDGLQEKFGSVVGNKLKRFAPRRMPSVTPVPEPQPALALASRSQRLLFP